MLLLQKIDIDSSLFHSIKFPLANIVLSCKYWNHRWPPVNDDFLNHGKQIRPSSGETTFGFSYFLRTREGYKSTVTKSRDDCWHDNPFQANLKLERAGHWEEPSQDPATADLACSIAGLVTITQFPLVHRMLQGVEHTDPTEWSNSHLSIGDKFI